MRVSTAPPPTPTVKTLQKQWLEAMAAYYYVLLFLFVGEWGGGARVPGGMGQWRRGGGERGGTGANRREGLGEKAGAPLAWMPEGKGS